jgi:hypothetical protein
MTQYEYLTDTLKAAIRKVPSGCREKKEDAAHCSALGSLCRIEAFRRFESLKSDFEKRPGGAFMAKAGKRRAEAATLLLRETDRRRDRYMALKP